MKKEYSQYWRLLALIITPLILLPLFFASTGENDESPKKYKCAYVILLMGIFWMTEAMPLAITSLIPVVLFPLLNIQSTGAVCQNYMRESVMMFLAGICLALAIEYSGLHKRIALKIMITIGTSPWRLLLGLMVTTMFLSCWIIINTAVVAMMIPIVIGLLECLDLHNDDVDTDNYDDECKNDNEKDKNKNLKTLFMLAVGYSSNIGGTAVIIGSNPNLIAKELLTSENIGQDGKYTDINFSSWIAFNMPIAIINLIISWLYLGIVYIGLPGWCGFRNRKEKHKSIKAGGIEYNMEISKTNFNGNYNNFPNHYKSTEANIEKILHSKLAQLGRITFHELSVLVIFIIVMILWFTRDPQIFQGWDVIFDKNYVKIGDSTIALAFVLLMFIIPKGSDSSGTILDWLFLQNNVPWNVVLLVGGGFAISNGAEVSGLSSWIGEQLAGLESLSNPIILIISLLIISFLTELLSNAACINIILPILIALSRRLNLHPLYLSLPGAIVCQYSFMLPVSNPTNALIFTIGKMKILDMIKAGAFLNFTCLLVLYGMNLSWGQLIFNYNNYVYPELNTN